MTASPAKHALACQRADDRFVATLVGGRDRRARPHTSDANTRSATVAPNDRQQVNRGSRYEVRSPAAHPHCRLPSEAVISTCVRPGCESAEYS